MWQGRFLRLSIADIRMRIPYENLPSCDRLWELCEDIYAARAEGKLSLQSRRCLMPLQLPSIQFNLAVERVQIPRG